MWFRTERVWAGGYANILLTDVRKNKEFFRVQQKSLIVFPMKTGTRLRNEKRLLIFLDLF